MRWLLVVFMSSLISANVGAQAATSPRGFTSALSALEQRSGARIGVSVLGLDGSLLLTHRSTERFAMCSTFKVLLVAEILSRIDAGAETLDRPIAYTSRDLLDYAPITKAHLHDGHMTVSELSAAAIEYSDNTAANLLLDASGGPAGLTNYLRTIGDSTTRLDRNETSLNSNTPGDARDTSTPDAMAATLRTLLVGDVLSAASREQLKAWTIANRTGNARLRAGFEGSWIIGDKTGTGANGAVNDVAVVFPRGLPPFVIVVFQSGSIASDDAKSAVVADVARITQNALAPPIPKQTREENHD